MTSSMTQYISNIFTKNCILTWLFIYYQYVILYRIIWWPHWEMLWGQNKIKLLNKTHTWFNKSIALWKKFIYHNHETSKVEFISMCLCFLMLYYTESSFTTPQTCRLPQVKTWELLCLSKFISTMTIMQNTVSFICPSDIIFISSLCYSALPCTKLPFFNDSCY